SHDAETASAQVKASKFCAVFLTIHSRRRFSPCPARVLPLLPAISPFLAPHDALSLIRNDENKKVRAHGSITLNFQFRRFLVERVDRGAPPGQMEALRHVERYESAFMSPQMRTRERL